MTLHEIRCANLATIRTHTEVFHPHRTAPRREAEREGGKLRKFVARALDFIFMD